MDAIVAVYADWGIGAKGTQPLVIPADRRRFRELTMGAAVIVGRRTLDDFPGGSLPPTLPRNEWQAAAGARKPRAHTAEHRDRGRAGGALPGGGRGRRRAV